MSISLRQLTFVGANEPAKLSLEPGLNIVYGASNTGKSFIVKSLAFMFGVGKLPKIEQLKPYDAILLALSLPSGREVTLYRAVSGGGFLLFDGLHESRPNSEGLRLQEKHSSGSELNLSNFVLSALELGGKQIVKKGNGAKDSLSLRHLIPFLLVGETEMMAERGPVWSGQYKDQVLDKNIFKLLLTGKDDSAVVEGVDPKLSSASRSGKLELVEELLAAISKDLGPDTSSLNELRDQERRLNDSAGLVQQRLRERQGALDLLTRSRRELKTEIDELSERTVELDATIARFVNLEAVYVSDLERLNALEEGGAILVQRLNRKCPVCGALPEHQLHVHEADEIRLAHNAAEAEVRSIQRDRQELRKTTASLQAELEGSRTRAKELAGDLDTIEQRLNDARPGEAQIREEYEQVNAERTQVLARIQLVERRNELVRRKEDLSKRPEKSAKVQLEIGIDGTTADEFAATVQEVLEAWGFPGAPRVAFDHKAQDITINGKERAANGKGVRAILHAAFKVAVLVYCMRRGLPHPNFLALDSPLVTYREPLKSRHGALAGDEQKLAATNLNERFYTYLAELGPTTQFLVLENTDPPASVLPKGEISTFTANSDEGRYGLL